MQGTHLTRLCLAVLAKHRDKCCNRFFFFFSFPPQAAVARDTFGSTDLRITALWFTIFWQQKHSTGGQLSLKNNECEENRRLRVYTLFL